MSEFRPSFKKVEGEVNVTIQEITTNNTVLIIGSVDDIVQDTLTTVATLPANGVKYVTQIICSGEDNGKWEVHIDSTRQFTQRTTDRNVTFDFSTPLKVDAAQVLDVKVTFYGTGTTSDAQATILGYQAT